MRRFKVYINCWHASSEGYEEILAMPNKATKDECDELCASALDDLIANHMDCGWVEILPEQKKS